MHLLLDWHAAVDCLLVYSYQAEEGPGNSALAGWRIMARLPYQVAAAVAIQRIEDSTFLGILLTSHFPTPGVGYPMVQSYFVFGANFQGHGP